MCDLEATFNEGAVKIGKEGGRGVYGVWEWVDVDTGVARWWPVGDLCDRVCAGFRLR